MLKHNIKKTIEFHSIPIFFFFFHCRMRMNCLQSKHTLFLVRYSKSKTYNQIRSFIQTKNQI